MGLPLVLAVLVVLAVSGVAAYDMTAHASDACDIDTCTSIPLSYILERNYADWSDYYASEDALLAWHKHSEAYLARDPANEFNRLMQYGNMFWQNFDTVAGKVDASFEVAAYVVAAQMLDGTYWSISEHNDRFWNDLIRHYNLTDIDDTETLRDMRTELADNICNIYVAGWVTVLNRMVHEGYTTPEQYLADTEYWSGIAMDSPLVDIPAGDAVQDEPEPPTPTIPQNILENVAAPANCACMRLPT